ncbi:winged helix-turn-helix transcriptional regulator [Methanoculleus sp. FWC-SCC1]|uniref:Winged helix-turn-helix transcriptional regulator n=1 Tax=Methanoculleus frigidifontis TaxID=2584085 RepID=A0ABT8MD46_9EURY|nr:winged helix-turn-helix transcriptional regulator [Methanoculleus sp. FWC-SCC1]MDN7025855.1 winged helix-turn-helix transcriptional regulator [Methanoculleus sp. FWC-SCC1]
MRGRRCVPALACAALLLLICQNASAIETGGYVVRPGYDAYPEYSDIYFETITMGDLREEPNPLPIPPEDLPLSVLFVLGIVAAVPLIAYLAKHLSLSHLPIIGGRSRISKKSLFENRTRETILRAVKENPGISLAELEAMAGSTYKNLRYHLDILEKFGMVVRYESDTLRYFAHAGKFSQDERRMLACLGNRRDKMIIDVVAGNPGISRQEIGSAVGISGPSVSWHVGRLEREGILVRQRDGSTVRHYLADDLLDTYRAITAERRQSLVES